MSTLTLTNTLTAGTPEDIGDVQQNFTDIRTWANGNVDDTNFPATAGMYTAYRTLLAGSGPITLDKAAGTYMFQNGGEVLASGANIFFNPIPVKYLDDADYAISGRSTRLRVRGVLSRNTVEPGITFTFGLYPVTFAGAADAVTATLGAVVASSTAAVNSTPAVTTTTAVSSDFAVPTDGLYTLGVVTSGALANNNASMLSAELQQHWV